MRITLFPPKDMFEIGARDNQEDCIFPATGQAKDSDRLFVLCDGMGGHEHGEKASAAICKGVSEYFQEYVKPEEVLEDEQLKNALDHAYLELDKIDDGAFRKAGTTLTLLFFHKGGCTAAHIGDSRIYHVRPSSLDILYKSKDHSLVYELYQMGEISYEEMKTHRRKNQITRAMLPGADNREVADIVHITDIQPGDYFFLCSDGVLENLDDPEIKEWMASNTDDDQKRQWLIDNTTNSKDNHSAFLIRIKDVEKEEGDESLLNDEQTVKFNAINLHPVLRKQPEAAVEETPIQERQGSPERQKVGKTERKLKRPSLPVLLSILACFVLLGALGWWIFNELWSESQDSEASQKVPGNNISPYDDARSLERAQSPMSDEDVFDVDGVDEDGVDEDGVDEDGADDYEAAENGSFKDSYKSWLEDQEEMSLMEEYKNWNGRERMFRNNVEKEYTYKGPVDGNGEPHGKGIAMFNKGIYKGTFDHGVMEGDDVMFESTNGNVFKGSFKENKPWNGVLYSKSGNIIRTVDHGIIKPRKHFRGPKDHNRGPNGSQNHDVG